MFMLSRVFAHMCKKLDARIWRGMYAKYNRGPTAVCVTWNAAMINSAFSNISRQQRERDRTLAAFWRPSSVWAHACEPEGCHAPRAALESRSIFSSAPQTGVKKISLHQENFQLSVAATCIFFCGKKASRRNTRAACRPNTAISVAEAATLWVRARWVFSL